MIDEIVEKEIDASVEAKTKDLTEALEHAAECIEAILKDMRHEMFAKSPRTAAGTLQILAVATARYAVEAKIREAQLIALMRMQEAANEEYTGEARR